MKSIVLAAALLTGAAILPGAAHAQVGFTLEVGTPPPPAPMYEPVPPPRYGYQWVPGFWDWNGREYVWVQGYWVAAREGYYYDAPTWIIIDNHWRLNRGGWRPGPPPPRFDRGHHHGNPPPPRRDDHHDGHHGDRGNGHWGYRLSPPRQGDRDRDGIPNRVDRDRDGDGVPNRYDRRPDNGNHR
jgi:hypothetical protein